MTTFTFRAFLASLLLLASLLIPTPEELTIFILASGPATASWPPPGPAFIVDVAATALDHLGTGIDPAWELDGMPLRTRGGKKVPPQ